MSSDRVFIEESRHSGLGASSAHRWRKCKGSNNLIERLIREGKRVGTAGEPAAEGTVAHTVFATAMEDGSDGHEFIGMEFATGGWTFIVDDEMADGVQVMLDLVRSVAAEDEDSVVYIEKGVQSLTDEDAFGTPDAVVIQPNKKRMVVVDLKYGYIIVEPDSDQNKYYGYLGIEEYLYVLSSDDLKDVEVELCIVQPRPSHPEGVVRFHKTTAAEVTSWWSDELLPDMDDTRDPKAMLMIGEHCRFCPAKMSCPALKQDTMEVTVDADPCHLTTAELSEIMLKKGAIEKFLESCASETFRRMLSGEKIDGWKVVKKLSRRTNKESIMDGEDENGDPIIVTYADAVIDTFGMDAYGDLKVRSIPQLEKLDGGPAFVAQWGYTPDNGPTIAPASDKRTEILAMADRLNVEDL